jgi:hypothetical protein
MSAPTQDSAGDGLTQTPTMYAPPWVREEARNAAVTAADKAIAASDEFRNALPKAAPLERRSRWREPKPFDGDLAIVKLRERPSLDPVVMLPPSRERGSSAGLVARVAGAVALAALAAFFMVGTGPLKSAVKAESEPPAPSVWSRIAGTFGGRREAVAREPQRTVVSERFPAPAQGEDPRNALPIRSVQTVPVQIAAVQVAAPEPAPPQPAAPEPAPPARALEADEIATLNRRSQELITQGDIAGARLLLTRAAEGGDARSALALGATYDAAALGRLGVRGIAPDPERARAWYAKAAELGSGEASRRLEQLAQSR